MRPMVINSSHIINRILRGESASFFRKQKTKEGDIFWVKERFFIQKDLGLPLSENQPFEYDADGNTQCLEDYTPISATHMPRWMSRITLRAVRVKDSGYVEFEKMPDPWAVWCAERMLSSRLSNNKKHKTKDYGEVTVRELAEKLPNTPYADDLKWAYCACRDKK